MARPGRYRDIMDCTGLYWVVREGTEFLLGFYWLLNWVSRATGAKSRGDDTKPKGKRRPRRKRRHRRKRVDRRPRPRRPRPRRRRRRKRERERERKKKRVNTGRLGRWKRKWVHRVRLHRPPAGTPRRASKNPVHKLGKHGAAKDGERWIERETDRRTDRTRERERESYLDVGRRLSVCDLFFGVDFPFGSLRMQADSRNETRAHRKNQSTIASQPL